MEKNKTGTQEITTKQVENGTQQVGDALRQRNLRPSEVIELFDQIATDLPDGVEPIAISPDTMSAIFDHYPYNPEDANPDPVAQTLAVIRGAANIGLHPDQIGDTVDRLIDEGELTPQVVKDIPARRYTGSF